MRPIERAAALGYTTAMRAPLPFVLSFALLACAGKPPIVQADERPVGGDTPAVDDPGPEPTLPTPDRPATPPHPGADAAVGALARLRALPPADLPAAVEEVPAADLEQALRLLQPEQPVFAWAALRLGRLQAHRRDLRAARATLNDLIARAPAGPAVERARATLARLDARQRVREGRLGVLLPLSGPYAAIGQVAKQAIELALADAKGVELVIGDTAGDAQRAPAVVERLVLEEGVAAIIGPIGAIESHTAARAAERLEVPIMTLASREDLTTLGPFVFRHRLTRSAQARAIATYACEQLGYRTFAILAPDSDYGHDMAAVFWQTVERCGGEIRGAQFYPPRATEFHTEIKKLIGRHDLIARRPDPHWAQLNRKSKDKALHVPPLVDFEALYVPDVGSRARLVLPFLSYWDVELRTSPEMDPVQFAPKYGGDLPQLVQVLGSAGFNSPAFAARAGSPAHNSVFVDAFWPEDPEAAEFATLWTDATGRPPNALAAHAYDAARLLGRAVVGQTDRDGVRRALTAIHDHRGVFGPTQVEGDGEVSFPLHVLTIRSDGTIGPHDLAPRPVDEDAPIR